MQEWLWVDGIVIVQWQWLRRRRVHCLLRCSRWRCLPAVWSPDCLCAVQCPYEEVHTVPCRYFLQTWTRFASQIRHNSHFSMASVTQKWCYQGASWTPHATVDNPRAHVISGPQGGEVGAAFLAARLRDVCSCLSSITYQKDLPADLKLQKNRWAAGALCSVLPYPITGGEGLAAPLQEPQPHYWLFEPQMAKLHWHCCSFSATRTLHATVLWLVISQKLLMWLLLPSVLRHCRLGGRKGIQPVKKLSGGVLAWLFVWVMCRFAYGPADATATHCLLL